MKNPQFVSPCRCSASKSFWCTRSPFTRLLAIVRIFPECLTHAVMHVFFPQCVVHKRQSTFTRLNVGSEDIM